MSDNTDTNTASEPRRKVGDILRDERILRDEDLKDVAKALAIRLPFMEAIESSEPQNLPGAAYALGFVRSYADYLGLDSRDLVDQYKEEAKELEREIALNFPEPLPSRGVPVVALLFIGAVLAVLFYGAWWYLNNQGKEISDYVPSLSQEQSEAIEAAPAESNENTVAETPATSPVEETVLATEENSAQETQTPTTVEEETPATTTESEVETATEAETSATENAVETTVEETVSEESPVVAPAQEEATPETPTETSTETTVEETVTEVEETAETAVEVGTDEETVAEEAVAEEAAPVVAETTETVTETVEAAPSETTESNVASEVEEAAEETASDTTTTQPEVPLIASAERAPRVYGEENEGSRVTLLATDSAWVEVMRPDGELTLTRLLRKGDRYQVPNEAGLTMVTGNAGGVMIVVDGNELGLSGPIGAVRRDYLLDADHLLTNGVDAQ